MSRLDKLRAILAARAPSNAEGKVEPVRGYEQNVAAIRADIARMEGRDAA